MYTELGGNIDKKFFIRNYYIPNDNNMNKKRNEFIERCKYTDVYQCVYSYETDKKENIKEAPLFAPFYLDMDADIHNNNDYIDIRDKTVRLVYVLHSIFCIPISQIQIFFSGHKGFHIIIDRKILGLEKSLSRLNDVYKAWAVHLSLEYDIPNIDTRIYDRRRLLRIPNTINGKTGLFKVWIPFHILKDSTYDFIKQYARYPKFHFHEPYKKNANAANIFLTKAKLFYERKPSKDKKNDNTAKFIMPVEKIALKPCMKQLLINGAEKGCRNEMTVLLANTLTQHGYDKKEMTEIVFEWNKCNNVPPLPENELRTTIESGYAMAKENKLYGCSNFKEAGLCQEHCILNK